MVVLSTAALPARGIARAGGVAGHRDLDEQGFIKRRDPGERAGRHHPSRRLRGRQRRGTGHHSRVRGPGRRRGRRGRPSTCSTTAGDRAGAAARRDRADPSGPPRIGVFVCHCGANIAGVVDVEQAGRARRPRCRDVVHATDDQLRLRRHGPAGHRGRHRRAQAQPGGGGGLHAAHPRAGVPGGAGPQRAESLPVRDGQHPRPVHLGARPRAARGAERGPATRFAWAWPARPASSRSKPIEVPVNRRAVVVGGGVAGLRAALDLDAQGYEVVLVEKSDGTGRGPGGTRTATPVRQRRAGPRSCASLKRRLVRVRGGGAQRHTELDACTATWATSRVELVRSGRDRRHVAAAAPSCWPPAPRSTIPPARSGYGEQAQRADAAWNWNSGSHDPEDKLFGAGRQATRERGLHPVRGVALRLRGRQPRLLALLLPHHGPAGDWPWPSAARA